MEETGVGVSPVVLGRSARSFISRLHFELSNYTRAERFTEINLPPALRTLPLFLLFLFLISLPAFSSRGAFHTQITTLIVRVRTHACWERGGGLFRVGR